MLSNCWPARPMSGGCGPGAARPGPRGPAGAGPGGGGGARSELMRRKLTDAMQYPAFVLVAAAGVMLFFILFVLPQFSAVLQDFGSKSDTALSTFIKLSDFLRANATAALLGSAAVIAGVWWLLRRPGAHALIMNTLSRTPGISGIFQYYRTSLFC